MPRAVPGRRPALAAAALWPLLVVLFHREAARPGMAFVGWDLRNYFFAVREATAAALRRGELPGWCRGMFLGFPLAADPQAAFFDPGTWLTLPWEAPRALTLATLFHLVLGGWGMIWWMRRRGLGAAEGLLAAVLFGLGAKQTAHLQHWNFAASTAWWPWMLGALDGFRESGRGRHLLCTSAAAAGSWFGGSPQMAYFGTLVAGAYALSMAPELWRRRPADALLALAAAPAGFLLAGPMVLPVAEMSRLGPRGAGVDYAFATSWKWPDRWGLALLLLPRAYGGRWWSLPEMNLWEATGYVGILTLGLVAAAPLRRRGNALFLALAAVGVWLSFGEDSWLDLHRLLFRVLPGYAAFRNPTRSLMVTSLAASLLAAEALAALRLPGGRTRALRAGAALAACGAAAAVLPRLAGFPLDRSAGRQGALVAAGFALGAVAWLGLRELALRRRGTAGAWALAATALAGADLHAAFGGWNPVGPADRERAPLADVEPLVPPGPGPRRVAVIAQWGSTANAPLRRGWEGVTGYSPTLIARVRTLLEATRDDRVRPPERVARDVNFPRPVPTSPLWPLFSAPLVVSDRPWLLPALAGVDSEFGAPTTAYRAEALPRAFFTASWEVRRDDDLEEPMLRAARGEVAVLAEGVPSLPPSAPPAPPVPASAVRLGWNRLEVSIDAPADGLLVILDPWYPGWIAAVDGVPAPLARADFAFMALPLKAGRRAVRLEYRNPQVVRGAWVAAGAFAALAGALAWRRAALRSPRPPAPKPRSS